MMNEVSLSVGHEHDVLLLSTMRDHHQDQLWNARYTQCHSKLRQTRVHHISSALPVQYNSMYRNIFTYLLSPWSTVLLQKLTGFAASQENPHIFGTQRFITVLTGARHLSLS